MPKNFRLVTTGTFISGGVLPREKIKLEKLRKFILHVTTWLYGGGARHYEIVKVLCGGVVRGSTCILLGNIRAPSNVMDQMSCDTLLKMLDMLPHDKAVVVADSEVFEALGYKLQQLSIYEMTQLADGKYDFTPLALNGEEVKKPKPTSKRRQKKQRVA